MGLILVGVVTQDVVSVVGIVNSEDNLETIFRPILGNHVGLGEDEFTNTAKIPVTALLIEIRTETLLTLLRENTNMKSNGRLLRLIRKSIMLLLLLHRV